MSAVVEEIDAVHEALSRFYKDDVSDPRCQLQSVFSDLLTRRSVLYMRISLEISPITTNMGKEGLRTRSRVKLSLNANTQKASGLVIHRTNTVRILSGWDIDRLSELGWSQKNIQRSNDYAVAAQFHYTSRPR